MEGKDTAGWLSGIPSNWEVRGAGAVCGKSPGTRNLKWFEATSAGALCSQLCHIPWRRLLFLEQQMALPGLWGQQSDVYMYPGRAGS